MVQLCTDDVHPPRLAPRVIWALPDRILKGNWIYMAPGLGLMPLLFIFCPSWVGIACLVPLLCVGAYRSQKVTAQWRCMLEQMRQQHPGIDDDPVSESLSELWRGLLNNPEDLAEVLEILENAGICHCGAVVVCMSPIEIPRVGERHFEPHVVNATELMWRDLKQLPLSGVWWLWMLAPIGGWSGFFDLRSVPSVLVLCGGPAIAWIWRRGVRPTYVRIAPGIVQVMTYSLFGGKPSIRSYPMEKGTLVLIIPDREKVGVDKVILSRGDGQDVLPISGMKDGPEFLEKLLWAVMSTAPIPRLDDEQLVG